MENIVLLRRIVIDSQLRLNLVTKHIVTSSLFASVIIIVMSIFGHLTPGILMQILTFLQNELPTELYSKLESDLQTLLTEYKQQIESDTLHSVACYWSVGDVLSINPFYTEDEAIEILNQLDGNWDASVGASWDDLEYVCSQYGQPKEFFPVLRKILVTLTDPPTSRL